VSADAEAWVVRTSVQVALVGYLAGPASLALERDDRARALLRAIWTVGFVAFVVHVLAAFDAFYAWSHAVAFADVARQSAERFGFDSGSGLYLNYLFLALWGADAAWWWWRPQSHAARPAALSALIHGFLFFIVFNGTVVFASGFSRWLGLVATAAWIVSLASLALRKRRRRAHV
jgi:formate hydrogenlyase subunit 3/multisubunit Na+/H+ antiporter MnhD subunit